MHKELFEIAKHYGDDCSNCKEVCCVNMALDITREETKRISKLLKLDPAEFRKKYTVMFKTMFDGAELKCISNEAKVQFQRNPRLLKFKDKSIDKIDLPEEQINRLLDISKCNKKLRILECPFYNAKDHRCTIHKARPTACYIYPFNYGNDNQVDLRKINACVLSTNCLQRISNFIEKMGRDNSYLETILKSKEYSNHFYIPMIIFYSYMVWECTKLKIPIKSPEIKQTLKGILGI